MWILIQSGFLVVIIGIVTLKWGWFSGNSVLFGGGAWIVPSWFFVWRMRQITAIFNVKKMLKSFLVNEMMKLLLSFGIIVLILLTLNVDKRYFLVGYFSMILFSSISFFVEYRI